MTSLPQLMEKHDQLAANQSPVLYAVLRTLRMVADGKEFNEGDFRDWIAAGEKLRGSSAQKANDFEIASYMAGVPLTTGDDDRPLPIVSPELVQMAVEAHEDAQKNGTEHWPTIEQVEHPERGPDRPFADRPKPSLAELTNIHTPKMVDGRTREGRELKERAALAARRNQA